MNKIFSFFIIFLSLYSISFSQPDKEEAERIALQGVEKCDHGFYDEAIRLFDEALLLDSGNVVYIYEKGYAYYMKKDYQSCIDNIEPLIKKNNSTDQFYQLVATVMTTLVGMKKHYWFITKGLKNFLIPENYFLREVIFTIRMITNGMQSKNGKRE